MAARVKQSAMQAFEAPFDVVVTTNSGYPLDQNLYQSVKGMSAAAQVVKPGGAIVCAAECSDGIPEHGEYGKLLASMRDPAGFLDNIRAEESTTHDQWQVQIQSQIQLKARVLLKSDGLTEQQIRSAHLEPVGDVQATVRDLLDECGPGARLGVLPQGPQTIPYLSSPS
jgi:nickel-dependent lactate racemase